MPFIPYHHKLLAGYLFKGPCDLGQAFFAGYNQWPLFLHSHKCHQSLNTEESRVVRNFRSLPMAGETVGKKIPQGTT